eukprot:Sspe_Gene.10922::Locus_3684_Transcript_2_2_Confidence_0.667_Length_1239::g.10922::m.10922
MSDSDDDVVNRKRDRKKPENDSPPPAPKPSAPVGTMKEGSNIHGPVLKETEKGDAKVYHYANGVTALVKADGTIIEQWPDKKVVVVKNGRRLLKTTGEDGKPKLEPLPASVKPPAPKISPKKESPKKESPKKPRVVVRKEADAPKKETRPSPKKESRPSPKKPSPSPPPKRSSSPAKSKPAAKRQAPRKTPQKRAAASSDEEEEEEVVKKEEPVDLNDESRCTLAQIAIHLASVLNLENASAEEQKRLADEALQRRMAAMKRPRMQAWPATFESLEKKIETVKKALVKAEADQAIKDGTKEVSLSTSKTNYIDPRVICAWCNRENVSISKVYNKSLQKKFPWATHIDPDWRF